MAIITSITAQKRRDRCNVYLDNKFYCGLQSVSLLSHNLKVGDEIDPKTLEEIQRESEAGVAFEKAISKLEVRMRSRAEIVKTLKDRGFLPQVIDATIEKLEQYGYLNDEAFARELVRSYPSLGSRAIAQKLAQKGVSAKIIDQLLAEINVEDEEKTAQKVAQKFVKTRSNDKNLRQKLFRHLCSKGFSFELCGKICKNILEDENND